ncbi:MAG: hypothetical protein H0T76_01275 [Nannocystis sp.]|nr:hypothetical protein [Nannocystis sp.]MBA3545092.1 hypothetical protein [Nannocystis sp.]
MGFFDKMKKFVGGKNTATVEITAINGTAPTGATINISDGTVRGSMSVTAQQDCTMLAMKYDVILRTQSAEGQWSDISVGSNKDVARQVMATGQVFTKDWIINGVDVETYLRNQSYDDMTAVLGHPKIKLVVRCTADVEGSPFDPNAEAEVHIGASSAGPCAIETTVIEGRPASIGSFPVTDSVFKGTVVVTAKSSCVLVATRYELCLELQTQHGPVEVVVDKAQHPEVKSTEGGFMNISVSFGGTNITFPHRMARGDKATQTWMVHNVDIPAKLAAHGFADPHAAVGDPNVKLVVKSYADVEAGGVSTGRTAVKMT